MPYKLKVVVVVVPVSDVDRAKHFYAEQIILDLGLEGESD